VRSAELVNALALTRGWIAGSGLPDETRAGRQLLKDYVDGKMIYLEWPPGTPEEVAQHTPEFPDPGTNGKHPVAPQTTNPGNATLSHPPDASEEAAGAGPSSAVAGEVSIEEGDLQLLREVSVSDKPKRAAHKFHKKAARSKGDRGQMKDAGVEGVGGSHGSFYPSPGEYLFGTSFSRR
jgi:large subunit GTPase 1